jgi:hypothetical protein
MKMLASIPETKRDGDSVSLKVFSQLDLFADDEA